MAFPWPQQESFHDLNVIWGIHQAVLDVWTQLLYQRKPKSKALFTSRLK